MFESFNNDGNVILNDETKDEGLQQIDSISYERKFANIDLSNEYDRLKIIDDEINNKNEELLKIQNKLTKIKKKELLIKKEKYELNEHSLPYNKKQEIIENNKIIQKLNLQNISFNDCAH